MPPTKPQPKQDIIIDKSNYIRERIEAAKQRKQDAAELAELWALNFPVYPVERQYTIWLRRYEKNAIVDSIERTAEWYDNEAQKAETAGEELSKTIAEITAYATGVMIRKTSGEVVLNGKKYTRKPESEEAEVEFLDESETVSFDITADDDELA